MGRREEKRKEQLEGEPFMDSFSSYYKAGGLCSYPWVFPCLLSRATAGTQSWLWNEQINEWTRSEWLYKWIIDNGMNHSHVPFHSLWHSVYHTSPRHISLLILVSFKWRIWVVTIRCPLLPPTPTKRRILRLWLCFLGFVILSQILCAS